MSQERRDQWVTNETPRESRTRHWMSPERENEWVTNEETDELRTRQHFWQTRGLMSHERDLKWQTRRLMSHELDNKWVTNEKTGVMDPEWEIKQVTNEKSHKSWMSQRRKEKKCFILRYLACDTHEQVMSNTGTSHVTRMNESRVAPVSVTNAFYMAVLISI